MSFERIFTDIIEEFRGRARYRIVSSFIVSFVMWNWYDVLVMLFDEAPFWLKASVLRWNLSLVDGLVIPLAFALGWMYLVPIINYATESFRIKVVNQFEDKVKTSDFVYRSTLLREKVQSLEGELLEAQIKLDEAVDKIGDSQKRVNERQEFLLRRFNQYAANRNKYINYVIDAKRIAENRPVLNRKTEQPDSIGLMLDTIINDFEPMNTIPFAYLEGDSVQALREFKSVLKDAKDRRDILIQGQEVVNAENLRINFFIKLNLLYSNIENFKPSITLEQLNNSRSNETDEQMKGG